MPKPSRQADLIRQWREHLSVSQEDLGFRVSVLARADGIPESSRKVPGTHASISRWESGVSEVKATGLALIARALQITDDEIREAPPTAGQPRRRRVSVVAEDAAQVEAFAEGLRAAKAK